MGKNQEYTVGLGLFGGCLRQHAFSQHVDEDSNPCQPIPGKNFNWCFSPESCYDDALTMMHNNNNNTDYWIQWKFYPEDNHHHTPLSKISRLNFDKESKPKTTNLDTLVLLDLTTGCDNFNKNCYEVIGGPDTIWFCNNATDCYYHAIKMWETYNNNPNYWIRMIFFDDDKNK